MITPTSVITPARAMGLAATGFAVWMMKGSYDDISGAWQVRSDALEWRNTYELMHRNRGLFNGLGMEGLVSRYNYLTTNGPMDLFLNFNQAMVRVNGLFNEVLTLPLLGLAAGGLYAGGFKPHRWVAAGGRAIWQTQALQSIGRGISSLARSVGFGFVRKGLGFLVGMGWKSVPLLAGLALFGHQFSRSLSGDETRSLFYNDIYERGRTAP
ncbi:MAG: hypothetical protein IPK79_02825 [Vampirovibrionales bacterium]|nr:hypothetical protein [Vampirovibrionales bacterium]